MAGPGLEAGHTGQEGQNPFPWGEVQSIYSCYPELLLSNSWVTGETIHKNLG